MLSWRAYTRDKKQYRIYALNHLQKLFASSLSHYREIFDMWRGYTSVRVSQRHGTVPRFVPTTARWDLFLELRVRMMQQRQLVRVPQHVLGVGEASSIQLWPGSTTMSAAQQLGGELLTSEEAGWLV